VGLALKVRLADVIYCTDRTWSRGYGQRISQKHLDFVLYDTATTRILLAIELDDRSHEKAHRKARDEFVDRSLDAAGVPLLRVRAAATYHVRWLKSVIDRAMR
jgi:hypothetical protein